MGKFQTSRKRKIRKVLLVLLLVPLTHLFVITIQYFKFNKIDNEPYEFIKIKSIKRGNRLPLEVYGLVGNVFRPISNNKNVDIDIVPVSCTVDPITFGLNNSVFWSYNDLLRSALVNTYQSNDGIAYKRLVNELVIKMTSNKKYIQYFIKVPKKLYNPDKFELVKINQPFIWEIPKGGNFHITSKINYLAAIPIFHPKSASKKLSLRSIHNRLKDNLDISLRRFLYEIESKKMYDVRTLGFTPIAASSNRLDSEFYLDYYDSYKQIVKSVGLYSPDNIDRVFIFIYDALKSANPEEYKSAKTGMFKLYHINWFENIGFKVIIYLMFVLFSLSYLAFYPKIKDILLNPNTKINRRNFIANVVGILAIVLSLLLLIKPILIKVSDSSIILVILTEIIVVIFIYKILLWISKFTRTNDDKIQELNEKSLAETMKKK